MSGASEYNFAWQLTWRLRESSSLADAATGETVSASDLRRLIPNFGAQLLAAGLKAGDRILIGCALSPGCCIAYLGAMYAGLVPVPVEKGALDSAGHQMLEGTGARAVWTEKQTRFAWKRGKDFITLDGRPADLEVSSLAPAPCRENSLAVLVRTSGSTGTPRFVMVTHGNLTANTEAIVRSQNLSSDDRAMLILPVSYCFGASVLHSHLYQGGGVVFDRRFMFPDKVLHSMNKYHCTTFAGVPTVYNILLRRSNIRSIPMPSLRRFLQAGGPLAPQQVIEMRDAVPSASFYVMYGQTEATARISVLDPERLAKKLGSVGRALDNLTVRIADEDGKDLALGQVGEVLVKGPSISAGYFDDPEASRRVFDDGWLRTGDLAHLDEDGYIWIHGRKADFLKTRGVRVSFAEIEAKVAAVPGVYECAVAAVAHPEAGEALALYIVPDKKARNVARDIRRSLPVHWTCDSINIVSGIPKTFRGKVSRASLGNLKGMAL